MKNIIKFIVSVVCSLAVFCSCEKEDNTFIGTDNYIISFVLEKGDVKYIGDISDGNIEITVPATEDLQGYTAKYDICELAVISPAPESISAWNHSQTFTVTAYNKDERKYQYTVKYLEAAPLDGDVVLKSQADVDAFGEKKVSVLNGNLTIGESGAIAEGADIIKNFAALASLKRVNGNITFNQTIGAVEDLSGLQNLEHAENLYFGKENYAISLENTIELNFANLKSVSGEIIINASNLSKIAFPVLENAMRLYVGCTSCAGFDFSKLANVYGTVNFSNVDKTETLALPALVQVDGDFNITSLSLQTLSVPALTTVGKGISFNNLKKLTSFDLQNLENIGGSLYLNNLQAMKKVNLESLKRVKDFKLIGATVLSEINLKSLETVAAQMSLNNVPALEALSFDNLKRVGELLEIKQSGKISSLAVPSLKDCGKISLYNVPAIESIDFSQTDTASYLQLITVPALTKVIAPKHLGQLEYNAANKDISLPEFSGIESVQKVVFTNLGCTTLEIKGFANNVKGIFSVANANNLKSLKLNDIASCGGMAITCNNSTSFEAPSLVTIAGKFDYYGKNLEKFDMPQLQRVNQFILKVNYTNGTIGTLSLPALTDIIDLQICATDDYQLNFLALKEIKGTLTIAPYTSYYAKNCKLTQLNGLSGVEKIGVANIYNMPALTDFSGLKNAINSLSVETWNVYNNNYNPTYQDMLDGKYTK